MPAELAAPVTLNSLYCSSEPACSPVSKTSSGVDFVGSDLSESPLPPCLSSPMKWLQNSRICMKLLTWCGALRGYLSSGNARACPGRCARRKRDPLFSWSSSQRIASRAELCSRFKLSNSCNTTIQIMFLD